MSKSPDQAVTSLYHLLQRMGVKCRWYDAGRRISKLSSQMWQQFEDGQISYPAPYLKHAWLGLAFWPEDDKQKTQTQLWCIRLPLDEQGKIDNGQRDLFLKHLLTAMGSNVEAAQAGSKLTAVLEGNPFIFKPSEEKQACLHAAVSYDLNKAPSNFYAQTLSFFQEQNWSNWQELGVQGLADLAERWQENQALISEAIPHLPEPVLLSLSQCLENHTINRAIAEALLQRIEQSDNASLQATLIRGVSLSRDAKVVKQAVAYALSNPVAMNVEMLASLSSRCGNYIVDDEFIMVFLEHLAAAGQEAFNGILADMLFQAPLRPAILKAVRSGKRSETLAVAIGGLFA